METSKVHLMSKIPLVAVCGWDAEDVLDQGLYRIEGFPMPFKNREGANGAEVHQVPYTNFDSLVNDNEFHVADKKCPICNNMINQIYKSQCHRCKRYKNDLCESNKIADEYLFNEVHCQRYQALR